jgi:hypothetical protein
VLALTLESPHYLGTLEPAVKDRESPENSITCSAPSVFSPPHQGVRSCLLPWKKNHFNSKEWLSILLTSIHNMKNTLHCMYVHKPKTEIKFHCLRLKCAIHSDLFSFFIFAVLGFRLRTFTLSHSTRPFLSWVFWDRVLWIICPGWRWTSILVISASWVARITGLSHRCPAPSDFLIVFYSFKCWSQSSKRILSPLTGPQPAVWKNCSEILLCDFTGDKFSQDTQLVSGSAWFESNNQKLTECLPCVSHWAEWVFFVCLFFDLESCCVAQAVL